MRLVANIGQANQASAREDTGGSLARRRPERPHHACVTPATIKLRVQRFSEGDFIGTSVQRYPVGRIVHETGYFPVSRATFGCWVRISRETYTGPGQR